MTQKMTAESRTWLELCRRMRPELSQAEFDKLVPSFLRFRRDMLAAKRRGIAS